MNDRPTRLYRLERLFDPRSHRCLDVAVDHGLFGEPSFLTGIEDMATVVNEVVAAGPDAIQLTPGLAHILQALPGKQKPALVLRADVANVYGVPLPSHLFTRNFPDAVEQAVRLDAACVVVNLFQIPGRPDVTESCIEAVMALRGACSRYAMPLMVEPLVLQANETTGAYMVDGDTQKIVALVRQACELGADVIKADPTDAVDDYVQVIQTARPLPVLVRGGGRVSDSELLARTERLIGQGIAGLVYGRNIIQHPKRHAMTRALMAMLHTGATAAQAQAIIDASAA